MDPIHFFRAGRHTSSDGTVLNFTAAELDGIAASYDPKVHEAPIVVGHPKGDAPAFGWVEKVIAKPDGLYAVPRQVNPEFAELVRTGAYKKVSGSFYRPDNSNHPKPGGYYLRHLGFLGAQPPAVKGLRPIELADDEGGYVNLEESFLDLREYSFRERERAFERREVASEIQRLNSEGRIPVGDVDGLIAFMDGLDDTRIVNFGEGDGAATRPQKAWFLDYLRKRPVMVETRELSGEFHEDEGDDFIAPPDFEVDPDRLEAAREAQEYQRKHGGSFAEAARAMALRKGKK